MSDFSTDRLEPAARGTPVATHTEPRNSQLPTPRRRKSQPAPAEDRSGAEDGREAPGRQIDRMA
jgi:hypothetical protein